MTEKKTEATCLPCQDAETKDWYAWINLMPPSPDDFHVVGEVQVPNPGVVPMLVMKEPQGINPNILLLDLIYCQQPGIWPEQVVWKNVRYDKYGKSFSYTDVQVYCEGPESIANMSVNIVT